MGGRSGRWIAADEYERVFAALVAERARLEGTRGGGGVAGRRLAVSRAGRACLVWALLGEVGLRVGELCGLVWSDLVVAGRVVTALRVRGEVAKGGRERSVPLSLRAQREAARGYALRTAESARAGGCVDLVVRLRVVDVTPRQVERLVGAVSESVLGRWVHPHCLRHLCGNRWRAVADVFVVQRLLGHASVTTTQRYTRVSGADLQACVAAVERAGCGGGGGGVSGVGGGGGADAGSAVLAEGESG